MYISKTHLNYSKEEFLDSTFFEICKMWEQHCKFNGWTKSEDKENKLRPKQVKKYVNIEDLPI
ncbi:hypothetical protein [Clostridium botulinum]|uniref:hypothetical protein n=1 Tax=Clostridium botulinum TaxID=1491 RepID=UPI00068CA9A8|nr:hypothetical protein [Clostridium botulinum]